MKSTTLLFVCVTLIGAAACSWAGMQASKGKPWLIQLISPEVLEQQETITRDVDCPHCRAKIRVTFNRRHQ